MIYKAGEYIPAGPPNRKNEMKKIIQTKQQRENTLDALNVMWPSVPPKNVFPELGGWRMNSGKETIDCGTIACFGGWCACWPNFKRQNVKANPVGAPWMPNCFCPDDVSERIFGLDLLFAPRATIHLDKGFTGTDHELVTHRLQWLLENSEVGQ